MSRSDRTRNEPAALKPIGFALAAVVAGLGTAKADPGATQVSPRTAPPEPTAASGLLASFAPDDVLVLDTPLEAAGNDVPLGEPAPTAQPDLFDPDVPLGGR